MLIAALLLQAAPAACPVADAQLPPALAGWTARAERLAPGRAVVLAPADPASSPFAAKHVDAGKPGKAAVAYFAVAKAGVCGLALDQKAWIDVYGEKGDTALASTGHAHGPPCSTIRKIVRFALKPGRYRALVSGIEKPTARLMLVTGPWEKPS